jgi:ketosteroid isomerase-like protein
MNNWCALLLIWLLPALATAQSAKSQPKPTMAASARAAADRRAILGTLARQTADWNAGRVEKFMQGYWPSDSLTFVGKGGITYGYAPTLANYQKRYPDRPSMGTLKFDILQLDLYGRDMAYVIGRWHLTRPQIGDLDGHFTLIWRKINGRWLIISDHSS